MELNEKDKELIAKIDEMLTQLKNFGKSLWELREHASLVLPDVKPDNEQSDKVEYVKCIDNSDCENVLIKGKVYKVNLEDETWIYVTDEEEDNENYSKKRFKPSTKEAYLKQFLPDNEQQAPAEITEQKERWQPAYGCKYWYIGIDDGNIFISDFHWGNDDVDFIYHDTANCFKTQEEAERAAQEIRKTLKNL